MESCVDGLWRLVCHRRQAVFVPTSLYGQCPFSKRIAPMSPIAGSGRVLRREAAGLVPNPNSHLALGTALILEDSAGLQLRGSGPVEQLSLETLTATPTFP